MSKPKRIQRKRTKGWRMAENCVYVGRPTRWGNPFTGDDAVARYWRVVIPYTHGCDMPMHQFYLSECNIREIQRELRGKDLACWCSLDKPCHADVLLEIANGNMIEE